MIDKRTIRKPDQWTPKPFPGSIPNKIKGQLSMLPEYRKDVPNETPASDR